MSPYTVIAAPDFPLTFTFERRRSGRQFYCWAHVLNGAESLSLGDPVVKNPTQATWSNAFSIILRNDTGRVSTLWQFWIAVV